MKDKGFRQIDNQYFLAVLAANLTRAGIKVLLAVIHYTLGYNQRDESEITLTEFQNLTKLSRPAVIKAVKELVTYGLISLVDPGTNRRGAIYRINKEWRGKVDVTTRGKVDVTTDDAKTLPPDVENFTSRGKVAEPSTEPVKKERKLIKKTISDASITAGTDKNNKLSSNPYIAQLQEYLGFPAKTAIDPVPSPGKEAAAIKRMLVRGLSWEAIFACWKGKVSERGGDFVSMTWVNEDIGKKGRRQLPDRNSGYTKPRPNPKLDRLVEQSRQSSRRLPEVYRDVSTHVLDKDGHLVQREATAQEE